MTKRRIRSANTIVESIERPFLKSIRMNDRLNPKTKHLGKQIIEKHVRTDPPYPGGSPENPEGFVPLFSAEKNTDVRM